MIQRGDAGAPLLTDAGWPGFLAALPADIDLDGLARRTKALRRRRGIPDAATLLRLALMVGPGGFSLRGAASWAALQGFARLTDPSLNDRLHAANDFPEAIVGRLLAGKAAGPSRRWAGRCLRLADGSSLAQPNGSGTDWRLHAVLDLERGGCSHLELTDGHGAESLVRGAAVPGEIRVADRNYGQAKALRAFVGSVYATTGADYNHSRTLRNDAMAQLAQAQLAGQKLLDKRIAEMIADNPKWNSLSKQLRVRRRGKVGHLRG